MPQGTAPAATCPRCRKPATLCVCAALEPVANRVFVLILQHPQEQDFALGTARLAHLQLEASRLAIGLSWPSLAAALGRPADPADWGVLYLGAARDAAAPLPRPLTALTRSGRPAPDQDKALARIAGLILLDGSWSQAKALWWRNPWLLKTQRLILAPRARSRYGALRREPRRESVSTIEAAALALAALEGDALLEERVLRPFLRLLERYRTAQAEGSAQGVRARGVSARGVSARGVANRRRRH